MLTRLFDAGVPPPVLVSGLIWALWHLPLILAGIYAAGTYPTLSAVRASARGTRNVRKGDTAESYEEGETENGHR